MILVDTNVLVALVLQKDPLHERAAADLERFAGREIDVLPGVLTEAAFILTQPRQRARLQELLAATRARQGTEPPWNQVFEWLVRYADHEPDWVDACLVVSSGRERRVWTYDSEFRSIWRRADGSRVPLASSRA